MGTMSKPVWAAPVRLTSLAAALEAYSSARPAIQTLRLCYAFGKDGLNKPAPITKLSQELIDMILEHMYMPQNTRECKEYEWNQNLACFERRCDDNDHWDEEEEERQRCEIVRFIRRKLEKGGWHPSWDSDEESDHEREDEDQGYEDQGYEDQANVLLGEDSPDEANSKNNSLAEDDAKIDNPAEATTARDTLANNPPSERTPSPPLSKRQRYFKQRRWYKRHLSDEDLIYQYGKTHDIITEDHISLEMGTLMHPAYRDDVFPDWRQWEKLCKRRRKNWVKWTDIDEGFQELNDILRSDFGLEIFVSRPGKTPTVEMGGYGYWDPYNRAQAWITLPCRVSPRSDEGEGTREMAQDEALRFRKGMKILMLGKEFKLAEREWWEGGLEPKKKPVWPTAEGEWPRLVSLITPVLDKEDEEDDKHNEDNKRDEDDKHNEDDKHEEDDKHDEDDEDDSSEDESDEEGYNKYWGSNRHVHLTWWG
ncbi:hypothetical protein Vi05172_g934 [Venturia inaequalis]|nr:hypothetical protein Vi05172_g934 [Venturia inaequalis]